jgi:hypothetical protein
MRKTIIYLLLFISYYLQAQTEKLYPLVTSEKQVGLSVLQLRDPYLSPLYYSGVGVKYSQTDRRYFNADNDKVSMEGKISALAGYTINSAYSAAVMYVGADYRWGTYYHFRLQPDLQFIAGANANINFGYKYNSRNVNNPVNIDAATNLNLAGQLRYDVNMLKRKVRFAYRFDVPVMGCMYVPLMGASYYEMFELGNVTDAVHFSSLHNKQGLNSTVTMDFPLSKSVLQLGFTADKLKYKANDMIFSYKDYSFFIGWKYNFYIFSGRKNVAPSNFISTEK